MIIRKVTLVSVGLLLGAVFCLTSCHGKVSHESIKEKMEKADLSKPGGSPFDDADYEFMIDYLSDNLERVVQITDYNQLTSEYPYYAGYSFIVMGAHSAGNLSPSVEKKLDKLREKTEKLREKMDATSAQATENQ